MTTAGRILIMPKGDYDASVTYQMLDLVRHGGTSWLCKKECTGSEPTASNTECWQNIFEAEAFVDSRIENGINAKLDEILDARIEAKVREYIEEIM